MLSLSTEALGLPRNSYMVRLSDGAVAAINDSFIELSRRLSCNHHHTMRKIHLWELAEGRDDVLVRQSSPSWCV